LYMNYQEWNRKEKEDNTNFKRDLQDIK